MDASPQPVSFPGDPDPGGRDSVAADVATAKANAMDRRAELQTDTFGQGSTIGDLLDLPPGPDAASKHTGPVTGG